MCPRSHSSFCNMIYCFDIDGTLCHIVSDGNYANAVPMTKAISEVNRLHDCGHKIVLFTARGASTGIDWRKVTENQLMSWDIKYDELITDRKPTCDVFVDDKAINALDWRKSSCGIRGTLAGAFDLIHPGYCRMFQFCKENCDHLTVHLHDDPSLERPKMKPVHTVKERIEILKSLKYVDEVRVYSTEKELEALLQSGKYDVRFLGDDYREKNYTGKEMDIPIAFVPRQHTYSTTALKKAISDSYTEYMKG